MKLNFKPEIIKPFGDLTPVKKYIFALPKLIRTFVYALFSPQVSAWMKLYAIAGITYFYSPLDIVPDIVTGIGFVDDTIFALLIMQAFLSKVDKDVLAKILKCEDTQIDQVFFNVREGTSAFAKFFASLYETVKNTFDALVKTYSSTGGESTEGLKTESRNEKSDLLKEVI